MHISFYGYTCLKIVIPPDITIITDLFDKSIGLKPPLPKADIFTFSCSHYTPPLKLNSDQFIIQGPGEYEIKGAVITGVSAKHHKKFVKENPLTTIYTFSARDIKLCHLGDIGESPLSEKQLEAIGEVDILTVPVGGNYLLGAKEAARIVNQLEPRIVIPIAYFKEGLKLKLEKLKPFLKEIGLEPKERRETLKINKKDLPQEETWLIELVI